MTPNKRNEDQRDSVLAAFLNECPEPTPSEIAEWRGRYPDFAADIMNFAADLLQLSRARGDLVVERTADELRHDDDEAFKAFENAKHRLSRKGDGH
jgi:hypothetical protein